MTVRCGSRWGGRILVCLIDGLMIISVWSTSPTSAQPTMTPLWYLTRGGINTDESWGVDTDSAGNIYWATHQTVPGPLADIYLYKLTPEGSEVWSRRWGDSWNEQAYVVAVHEPYVLVGGTKWTGLWLSSCDMALVCWTTDGDSLWSFTWDQGYGYEELDGLVVEEDVIYAAGWTTGDTTGNDLAVLKLNLSGQLLESTTWGTPQWDEANGQIAVDDENVYVAGRYDAPNELVGGDAVLAAFNKSTLSYRWHRTWGGDGLDDALGMTSDGIHLYVVGVTLSFGGSHIFLLTYERDGDLVRDRLWGGTGNESSRCLDIAEDGQILVAGKTTAYGSGEHDVVLLKFTPQDSLLWFQTWGGSDIDEPHGIARHDDIVYIAGETWSYGRGKNDALLIKATVEGQFPATFIDAGERRASPPLTACLHQNYPNPFNATTLISFSISQKTRASLKIFDICGREVARLVDDELPAGEHEILFQADELPSGVYLCHFSASGVSTTKKLTLLR